jgi:O-succinylhomoserine sulfhydrylase
VIQTTQAVPPPTSWRAAAAAGRAPDRQRRRDRRPAGGPPQDYRLIYPGRADQPQAATVKKQMRGGSNLVAFEIKGGKPDAFRFLNALQLVHITNNLGDAKSLVTHPTTTTHQRLTPQARAELGITDGLVRLSVGLEHRDDIAADLTAALEKA